MLVQVCADAGATAATDPASAPAAMTAAMIARLILMSASQALHGVRLQAEWMAKRGKVKTGVVNIGER